MGFRFNIPPPGSQDMSSQVPVRNLIKVTATQIGQFIENRATQSIASPYEPILIK